MSESIETETGTETGTDAGTNAGTETHGERGKRVKHSNKMKRIDVAIVFKNSGYKHFVIHNSDDVIKLTSLLCNALRETGDISNFIIVDRGRDCTCNFTV